MFPLYEDSAVAVFCKPADVLSEGGENDMTHLAAAHFGSTAHPIHRLDAGVSGAMLFAKTSRAAAALSRQVQEHRVEKEYRAVVSGVPDEPEGVMEDLLFKDSGRNKTFVVQRVRRGVRPAITHYRVLETREEDGRTVSLLQLFPKTGRTHQLRVQLSHRKMPIFGDRRYGSREKAPLALFCHALTFTHPDTGETLHITCPMPTQYPWTGWTVCDEKEQP